MATATETSGFTPRPTGPVLIRNAIPRTRAKTPPTLRKPWVGALRSATKRSSASSISSAAAMFTGKLASEMMASTAASPPTTPGKIKPGFESSVMMPYPATMMSSAAMVGSMRAFRNTCQKGIGESLMSAPAEWMTRLPLPRGTERPSIWLSSEPMSVASRSATCRRTASSALMFTLLRTACSAQSALRPCIDARLRTRVTASLRTLAPRSPVRSSPVAWIG